MFASEVLCEADDYRYAGQNPVEIRACRLPKEIEQQVRRLAAALQLPVAGVDLRRTPAGEWFCFEVNPSPAFTYYEEATGQPIAYAVARLLANDSSESSSISSSDFFEPRFERDFSRVPRYAEASAPRR